LTVPIYVGIDLGGTSIKLALIDQAGDILYRAESPTDVQGGGDSILYQIRDMIETGLRSGSYDRAQIKGVGMGAPGFLRMKDGVMLEAVNIGWKNYPVRDRLQQIVNLPVFLENDANVAAYGEQWKGAGKEARDVLCVTLGTGVGGGVIINNQIHHGANDTAGEIGHMTVIPEGGYRCNCGKYGCLETVASATGMVRIATDMLVQDPQRQSTLRPIVEQRGKLVAKDIAIAAQEGDVLALDVIDRVAFYLGLALGNYAIVMNPEKIVIGGGVSKAGDVLFEPLRKYYRQFALSHLTGEIEIVPAILGNDAGMIGAARLVHAAQAE
jgi:glucokinase